MAKTSTARANGGAFLAGIVVFALCFVPYFCHNYVTARQEANQKQQDATDQAQLARTVKAIGDVDLNPVGMTLATMRHLLKSEGRVAPNPAFRNSTQVSWDDLGVTAAFYGGRDPSNADEPITITIVNYSSDGPVFRGSIGGVHLGDPVSKAETAFGSEDTYPMLGRSWHVSWTKNDGRVDSLSVSDTKYGASP